MSVTCDFLAPFAGDDDGEELVDEANARRHGRPLVVIPLHVTAGFSESERGRIDSGVLAIWGIVS